MSSFLGRPRAEKLLLVRAWWLLLHVRCSLLLFGFSRTVRRLRRKRRASFPVRPISPAQIGWAVGAAGRLQPRGDRCLPKALAARALLARAGHPGRLRIGVLKEGEGRLDAHAWVESGDDVVIGGGLSPRRYHELESISSGDERDLWSLPS